MFIREYKDIDRKTGKIKIKHKLVAAVRTDKGPRQKVVMPLGTLTVPRIDWKRLAHALECRITGQQSLLKEHDTDLELLALRLISNNELSKCLEVDAEVKQIEQEQQKKEPDRKRYVPIDLSSVKLMKTRSLGAELLCMKAWDMLGLTDILTKIKFLPTSIAICMALIFGRMISPGSERHTIEWFRKRSALQELPDVSDVKDFGKDRFYEIADDLYANKDRIEEMLYLKEREYFPHTESTIYLYDMTNTYLEGHGLNNKLAARGHCKSKRNDCPLIALSLVIDNDGMPICSQIYKGSQSEPETMEAMMKRLLNRMYGNQIPITMPTVVMDRGIATADNVKWLQENNYQYIIIKREDGCEEYRKQFESSRETFEFIKSKKNIYGDENGVYVRKEAVGGDLCRILCVSDGKGQKEKAIYSKKDNPFIEDIEKFRGSIKRGTIKKSDAIENKLNRILEKHLKTSVNYEVSLEKADEKITGISLIKKDITEKPLFGCYVIETTQVNLTAEEIWKLYMTLTRVESAFRSMKEKLGMRPIYHQTGDRSASHLFLSVLAYHLLATIENLMARKGDTRNWCTLRDVMSTLMRGTIAMRDDQGASYHIRLSGEPEEEHQDILNKMEICLLPKSYVSKIDTL